MEAKHERSKPKLDRRNAVKNIEYDASSSSSVSSSPPSAAAVASFYIDESPTPRTRSLDLDPKTSFRVKGIDGEFDLICQTLGFSGPEDFAIPTAVWEAQKARRSSFDSGLRLRNSAGPDLLSAQFKASVKIAKANGRFKGENEGFESKIVSDLLRFGSGARISDEGNLFHEEATGNDIGNFSKREGEFSQLRNGSNLAEFGSGGGIGRHRISVRTIRDSGNGMGIKGERPPVLAPPPAMLGPPMIDSVSSTWDILKSFAPHAVEDLDSSIRAGDASSSDSEEGDRVSEENEEAEEDDNDANEERQLNLERIPENEVLSEVCSPPPNNDDDYNSAGDDHGDVTSFTVMEPEYCISPNVKFRRSISSWQKGELLGSGSFGTVYEGFTDDGLFFAVKEVSLLDQGSQGKQSILQLEQEISLLRKFEHENIIRYLGTDKDEAKLYIFLELATKGSLAKLYQKYRLRDSQVSAYTRQILSGLRYLHDQDVVHRDIKCANILVDANGSVKLADFGLAKATKLNDIKSSKGTAYWMAPEMQALFRIGRGEPPPVPKSLSEDAQDFIFKCLQVNSNDRPTATQLLSHPFVKRPHQTFLSPYSPRYSS
ncbi:mitogen-activated protein kinase kinase kinase 1 isoform X2 [Manihot esculenta]|uniref:Uncharacterized protein n=1 Tax=Manihot esculenta TaxID=3983 RepID=A0ACB7H1X6_MANES|nr:mitogen-activated protein kinase kinase kinase 1 isoform X2 [Manihot esculenta]KAG8646186.1 hypothetical protein MANES_10G132600v8 [Manihot esculenta]